MDAEKCIFERRVALDMPFPDLFRDIGEGDDTRWLAQLAAHLLTAHSWADGTIVVGDKNLANLENDSLSIETDHIAVASLRLPAVFPDLSAVSAWKLGPRRAITLPYLIGPRTAGADGGEIVVVRYWLAGSQ